MKQFIKKMLLNKGYTLSKVDRYSHTDKTCINIGAGNWSCPNWINLDYPSEWYKREQKNHSFIPYDIRNDELPFDDNSVDRIYCSHVIEHIEDEYVYNMFNECYRVLRKDGG